MSAADIAVALGDAGREGRQWRCRCPVHYGVSLVLGDGGDGRLLVRCWGGGCDPREILAELRRRRLITERDDDARPLIIRRDNHADAAGRIAMARRLWEAAQDARGSPVVRYLASRGISLPPPPSLRWAPRCWHREARAYLPAMVARVEHTERGFVGCHRTYLTGDYHRRDRATIGPIRGGAVRLGLACELLMVAEGIETALAAMQATGLGAWAALSTSGMVTLVLPPIVRTVVILADNDRNGAGERAARAAAQRWLAEGRKVRLAMPPEPGTDFADVLLGRAFARIKEVLDVAA